MLSPVHPGTGATPEFSRERAATNILRAISREEKFAREISEEVGISRPLVNIYLKQFEKVGLSWAPTVSPMSRLYLKRYYKAVPFELIVNQDLIRKLGDD